MEISYSNLDHHWDAISYECNYSYVWQSGIELVNLLNPQKGERILDLGCGTGQITKKIANSGSEVIGLDNLSSMIKQAQTNFPNLHFVVADARNFHFTQPFDAVFSNAVLHWIKEPEKALICIWNGLKAGGRFIAEFGGKESGRGIFENFHTIILPARQSTGYPAIQEQFPWYFPSIDEYTLLMEQVGFCITQAQLLKHFTPLPGGENGLRLWIEMFASSFLKDIPVEHHINIIRNIEEHLRPK